MGKWAQYMKRGSAPAFGVMSAPVDADWTAVTGAAGVITVTRLAPVPTGATSMLFRAINNATNVVAHPFNPTLTGLAAATQFRVQSAWFNGSVQVSDASTAKLVTSG